MRFSKVLQKRSAMRPIATRREDGGLSPDGPSKVVSFLYRKQEQGCTFFRSDRYFTVSHEWFVTAREGPTLGPHPTRSEATVALARYLAKQLIRSRPGAIAYDDNEGREATELEDLVRLSLDFWAHRSLLGDNSTCAWLLQQLDMLKEHPAHQGTMDIKTMLLNSLLDDLDSGHTGLEDGTG